jgi:predicted RNase H-like HicB family nuclease
MDKYSVCVKWSDEDEGFIATVPEFRGLSAFGKTQQDALAELVVAADAYLESWLASGRPLPLPEKVSAYSGQLRLRMPKALHARLAESARNQGVSLNTYLVSLLSERQGEGEAFELIWQELKSMGETVQRVPDKMAIERPGVSPGAPATPSPTSSRAGAVKEKKRVYKR